MSKHKNIKLGLYRHFKGNEYKVIGLAQQTELDENLVLYQDVKNGKYWARPEKNFFEKVEVDGEKKERFEFISEIKEEYEEKYLRALAEHQNLLKQTAKEKDDFRQFAQIRFIEQILPIYDNLKISLVHVGEEKSSWVQGVEYVVKQFADTLKQMGVEEIETAGKKFNHQEMEAVSEVETMEDKKIDHVAQQITSGYQLNGRVVRAARVVVYKKKSES